MDGMDGGAGTRRRRKMRREWNCCLHLVPPPTSLTWTYHLEQSVGQCDLSFVSADLPSASENSSVPGLIPWHYHRQLLTYYPPLVDTGDFITWTTLKIHDWLAVAPIGGSFKSVWHYTHMDFSSVNWDETVVQRYWVAEADFFFS